MKNFVKYTSIALLSSGIFLSFASKVYSQNKTSKNIQTNENILVGAGIGREASTKTGRLWNSWKDRGL